MVTPRREWHDDATAASSQKRILREGHRAYAASSFTKAICNPPIAPQALQSTLEEGATPPPRGQVEGKYSAIADQPASEDRDVLRSGPTYSASPSKLETTMREQISSISALVEDTILRLFGNAAGATESSS